MPYVRPKQKHLSLCQDKKMSKLHDFRHFTKFIFIKFQNCLGTLKAEWVILTLIKSYPESVKINSFAETLDSRMWEFGSLEKSQHYPDQSLTADPKGKLKKKQDTFLNKQKICATRMIVEHFEEGVEYYSNWLLYL